MPFYEDDRIIRKQRRYLIQKAEMELEQLKKDGITGAKLMNLLKARSIDTTLNETQQDIYKMAIIIVGV